MFISQNYTTPSSQLHYSFDARRLPIADRYNGLDCNFTINTGGTKVNIPVDLFRNMNPEYTPYEGNFTLQNATGSLELRFGVFCSGE